MKRLQYRLRIAGVDHQRPVTVVQEPDVVVGVGG